MEYLLANIANNGSNIGFILKVRKVFDCFLINSKKRRIQNGKYGEYCRHW
jgi:hypothetical protein